MSFKLLAIRPLKGCSTDYRKILKEGIVYKFYNDFDFKFNDDEKTIEEREVIEIENKTTTPINIYNVENAFGKPINISLSAIVGMNGSGKSTLPDLLLYSLFRILNYLGNINKLEEKIWDSKKIDELNSIKNFNYNIDKIRDNLKVEIYYQIENTITIIKITNTKIVIHKSIKELNKYLFNPKAEIDLLNSDFRFESFFYTILMNYSLHALNSNEIGNWVNAFFHKNDGYKMPVVINPYRTKGSIDINNERVLTRDRLLANILLIENYNINRKAKISKVSLLTNSSKFDKYQYIKLENVNSEQVDRFSDNFKSNFRQKILIPLFEGMFKGEFKYPIIRETATDDINPLVEAYTIYKIINVFKSYDSFKEFDLSKDPEDVEDNFDFEKLSTKIVDRIVNSILNDRSHITLKIRQSLNFIRKNIYTSIGVSVYNREEIEIGDIGNKLKDLIEEIKDKIWFTEIIDYLPPPIFFSKIYFDDGSIYEQLSSGEKQQIQALNSIIYHLRNLDSVHKKGEGINIERETTAYKNINLILDEIELYYHPEFQRRTVDELLFFIEEAKFEFIENINICLITHSPFILSDIINTNILCLSLEDDNKSSIPNFSEKRTFGANIHDLLADDFFLNSFMGEFAKQKINDVIDSLKRVYIERQITNIPNKSSKHKLFKAELETLSNNIVTKEGCELIIKNVGEPMLQNSLMELYTEAYPEERDSYLQKQIDYLTALKKKNNDSNRY